MIALNKFLEETEKYKEAYKVKGLYVNFDEIIQLSGKLSQLEKESEGARAECNKLCAVALSKRNDSQESKDFLNEINRLNALAKQTKSAALKIEKEINNKLKKLHNLPDYIEFSDKILANNQKNVDLCQFVDFLKTLAKVEEIQVSATEFIRANSDKILNENDFPIIKIYNAQSIIIFASEFQIEQLLRQILTFLSSNAVMVKQIATPKLCSYAATTYISKLDSRTTAKVVLKREYDTRKYKIKYHETRSDINKFVNEIEIKITKKR